MTSKELHKRAFVLDSHCDTPSQILKFNRDLSLDNNEGHVDFPKLSKAGVNASFFALYVPPQMGTEEAFAHAGAMLGATRKAVAANCDKLYMFPTRNQFIIDWSASVWRESPPWRPGTCARAQRTAAAASARPLASLPARPAAVLPTRSARTSNIRSALEKGRRQPALFHALYATH